MFVGPCCPRRSIRLQVWIEQESNRSTRSSQAQYDRNQAQDYIFAAGPVNVRPETDLSQTRKGELIGRPPTVGGSCQQMSGDWRRSLSSGSALPGTRMSLKKKRAHPSTHDQFTPGSESRRYFLSPRGYFLPQLIPSHTPQLEALWPPGASQRRPPWLRSHRIATSYNEASPSHLPLLQAHHAACFGRSTRLSRWPTSLDDDLRL